MSGMVLGLDTSNYRTSLAIVSMEGEILLQKRKLLPVPQGARGLRQSDAVYAHLKQMKEMWADVRLALNGAGLEAVCASERPREMADSYMPVFEAGSTVGQGIAAAMGIPFFGTDHQHGHLRAAQRGTEMEGASSFLAMHLSGGTTDLLWIRGERIDFLGSSLDLHAGQLVDRVGVAMGCAFPSGPEMEEMAWRGKSEGRLGCAMGKGDLSCHLSGAEAQAMRLIQSGVLSREDMAREIFDLLCRTVVRMLAAGAKKSGERKALLFGGIASSLLFREMLWERMRKAKSGLEVCFGQPGLSGDNAVGVALIGVDRLRDDLVKGIIPGKEMYVCTDFGRKRDVPCAPAENRGRGEQAGG